MKPLLRWPLVVAFMVVIVVAEKYRAWKAGR